MEVDLSGESFGKKCRWFCNSPLDLHSADFEIFEAFADY